MKIADIEKIERVRGYASTVSAKDFRESGYAEGVAKLLYDGERKFGDDWIQSTASKLYAHRKNDDGDLVGSNFYSGVAIATFTNIPLITGQKALELYQEIKRGFGDKPFYIDFGTYFNGRPERNPVQAEHLLKELSHRGIKTDEGVIDYGKLRLDVNANNYLVFNLSEDFSNEDIVPASIYPFASVGKNGLFGAFLDWCGWSAYVVDLAISYDGGRVGRYDAGVAREKSGKESDLVETLRQEFLARL